MYFDCKCDCGNDAIVTHRLSTLINGKSKSCGCIKFNNPLNRGNDTFTVKAGDGFAQGIFTEFGITEDDAANGVRNGGFGSTTGK